MQRKVCRLFAFSLLTLYHPASTTNLRAASPEAASPTPRFAARGAAEIRTDANWLPGRPESARLPVAMAGFSAVALRDRQEWEVGSSQLTVEFDGRQYLFASDRDRVIFTASPALYAPVLGGDCLATFAATGERVAGTLEHGLVRGGRIYFFADVARRAEFDATPQRFDEADLIDQGRCIVSRHDQQRVVQGIPETFVVRDGLRFYFASAHERTLFLEDIDRYEQFALKTSTVGATKLTIDSLGDRAAWRAAQIAAAKAAAANPIAKSQAGKKRKAKDRRKESLFSIQPSMGGYCPVSIRQDGVWVRGRDDHRVEVDNLVFRTAGPEQQEAFEAEPTRYIPALGGYCVVSMVDESTRVRGSVFHAVEYQGRLFLFADAAHRAAFKADPAKYARFDLANDGNCIVSQIEAKQKVPGLPEFAVWWGGKLYRFAGDEQKRKFLADPAKFEAK